MPNFKATTWNVENLFRPNAVAPAADQQRYQQKLALLAATITQLDPDVVALQEVGEFEPLHDLQQHFAKYPHASVSSFPDDRGIRVAFLSKHAMAAQEDIVDFAGQLVAPVTDDPDERADAIAPDHAPVSATFSV